MFSRALAYIMSHEDGTDSGGASELAAMPGLRLDVADRYALWYLRERESISRLDWRRYAAGYLLADADPLRDQDVPHLAARQGHQAHGSSSSWVSHNILDDALDGLVLISFQVLDVCSVPVRGCPIPRTSCASILRYDSMSHCITPTAVLALWPTRSRCPLRPASPPPSSVPER